MEVKTEKREKIKFILSLYTVHPKILNDQIVRKYGVFRIWFDKPNQQIAPVFCFPLVQYCSVSDVCSVKADDLTHFGICLPGFYLLFDRCRHCL